MKFPWTSPAKPLRECLGEGGEVRKDLGGAGGLELGGGVGAGGDTPNGEAGVLAGFDVPGRIADEEGFGGRGVELGEGVLGELDLGF